MFYLSVTKLLKYMSFACLALALAVIWTSSFAQDAENPNADPTAREWLDFKRARYLGNPILVHLRSGYERAVIMPEPVRFNDPSETLPGCAVAINEDVVGFFATRTFQRTPIRFQGLNSGILYELRVRASPDGFEQALQILR